MTSNLKTCFQLLVHGLIVLLIWTINTTQALRGIIDCAKEIYDEKEAKFQTN